MTHHRSTLLSHSSILRCALIVAACAAIGSLGLASQDRSGGGDRSDSRVVIPDYLATLNARMFSIPKAPTALTRSWVNTVLNAQGGAEKLADLQRVEFTCELTGTFGVMTLDVTVSASGDLLFEQVVQTPYKGVPARSLTFSVTAGAERAVVGDGETKMAVPLAPGTLSALRRAGDMWNPMVTMLGQFEVIESVGAELVNGRPCLLLKMGKPRLDGLTTGSMWIDAVTFMPVAAETNVLRDVPISGKYTISDWQTVSGIQVPKSMSVVGPDGDTKLTFGKVKLYRGAGDL